MGISLDYAKELTLKTKQRQLSVLFVEDDKSIRDVMKRSLDMVFKRADLAEDGIAALELLGLHQYDLIITDINMPRSSGVDLIHSIRKRCKTFPIIITTAYSEFVGLYTDTPNIYIIKKPYSILDILEALDILEEEGRILVEDDIYDKLEEAYNEAKRVLDLLNNKLEGE